jgi:hypothetical protein
MAITAITAFYMRQYSSAVTVVTAVRKTDSVFETFEWRISTFSEQAFFCV